MSSYVRTIKQANMNLDQSIDCVRVAFKERQLLAESLIKGRLDFKEHEKAMFEIDKINEDIKLVLGL